MRSLFLAVVLAAGSLGALALTPSESQARPWWGYGYRPYWGPTVAIGYVAPSYYGGYVAPTYGYYGYSGYTYPSAYGVYNTSAYYGTTLYPSVSTYPAYTGVYVAPSTYYGVYGSPYWIR